MSGEDFAEPRVDQAHLVQFTGIANPTGEDDSYDGHMLTKSQLAARAKTISGTPLWYEHEGSKKVGWITKGWVRDDGALMVKGVVARDTEDGKADPIGARAARELREGKLKGLSLGLKNIELRWADKDMRVAKGPVEEVSLTALPDRHEALIVGVAPESEAWTLAEETLDVEGQVEETKRKIEKNRVRYRELVAKLPTSRKFSFSAKDKKTKEKKQPTRPSNAHFTVTPIRTKASATMAEDAAAAVDSADGAQDSKMGETSGEGKGKPDKNTDDMSELEAMRKKMVVQKAEMKALRTQHKREKAALAAMEKDPDYVAGLVAEDEQRKAALRKQMIEGMKDTKAKIVANFVASGGSKADAKRFIQTFKTGVNNPEQFAPMYEYVSTKAGALAEKRAGEAEANYQHEKAQNEKLRERMVEAEQARDEYEKELSAVRTGVATKQAYAAHVGHANPRSQKRMREDEPESAAGSAPAPTPAVDTTPLSGPVVGTPTGTIATSLFGMVSPSVVYNPARDSDRPEHQRLVEMMDSTREARANGGADNFAPPTMVNMGFQPVTSGLDEDGALPSSDDRIHEVRSAGRPTPFMGMALPQQPAQTQ